MPTMRKPILFFAAVMAVCGAGAKNAPAGFCDSPHAGGHVLTRLTPNSFKPEVFGSGSVELKLVTGAPGFATAVQVVSNKRGNPWDVQFHVPVAGPLMKNEVLLVHFWARTQQTRAESGAGTVEVTVQKNTPDWDASISRSVNVPTQWKEFYFRGVSKADYGPNATTLDFRCGTNEQTLEIGGIELVSYGQTVSVTTLPSTRSTYPGREANAPWRAEAEARIRKLRMAPFTVQVRDTRGRSVPGATVQVHMTRSAFGFGAAVQVEHLVQNTPQNAVFQKTILDNFNSLSFVNDLKWPAWIGEWGGPVTRQNALAGLNWAKAHDLDFRGHVLVWPAWRNLPDAMRAFEKQPNETAALTMVRDHIRDEVSQTRGRVSEWDVINEPFDNHDLMDAYGKNIMVDWFNEAHKAAPQARLTLNDYGILTSQTDTAHEQHYEDTARYLLQNDAPLTMLGMQGHFGDTPPTPTRVYQLLSRYAKLGVPIRITEYTMDTDDEALRADWTRDFLTVLYSHPGVVGWQCWTFEELFDTKTGRPKPAGLALQKLERKWRTDLTASSGKTGDVKSVGYRGTYRVSATRNGRTVSKTVTLTPGASSITLVLP